MFTIKIEPSNILFPVPRYYVISRICRESERERYTGGCVDKQQTRHLEAICSKFFYLSSLCFSDNQQVWVFKISKGTEVWVFEAPRSIGSFFSIVLQKLLCLIGLVCCLLWIKKILLLLSIILVLNFFIPPPKSYREFHEDLFPDTVAREASMTADEWFSGINNPVSCDIISHLNFCCARVPIFYSHNVNKREHILTSDTKITGLVANIVFLSYLKATSIRESWSLKISEFVFFGNQSESFWSEVMLYKLFFYCTKDVPQETSNALESCGTWFVPVFKSWVLTSSKQKWYSTFEQFYRRQSCIFEVLPWLKSNISIVLFLCRWSRFLLIPLSDRYNKRHHLINRKNPHWSQNLP